MVIIQDGSVVEGVEHIMEAGGALSASEITMEGTEIALDGSPAEVTLAEQDTIQMTVGDVGDGTYTITTTEGGETYISSADGQLLTQVQL